MVHNAFSLMVENSKCLRRVGWNCNTLLIWGAGAGGFGLILVHFTTRTRRRYSSFC